jgi:ribose 5-phosphate isomerase
MNDKDIYNLIPLYAEGGLTDAEKKAVEGLLARSAEAKTELEAYKKMWLLLDEADTVKPSANYVSNFWTALSKERTLTESFKESLQNLFHVPKLAPVLATALIVLVVGVLAVRNYTVIQNTTELAQFSDDDIEMIDNMDLAENLDVIADLDFLQDLDAVEGMDQIEA